MKRPHRFFRAPWDWLWQRVLLSTSGGRWTGQLSPTLRHNLRWFWFDGLFAQASEVIFATYFPLFILALGATRAQIGMVSALSSLSAMLVLLPGAAAVDRWGRRKNICLISSGLTGRALLLVMALVPLVFGGRAAVVAMILLIVLRNVLNNFPAPAWTSLTADIVPLSWRGRYFSSRNVAMGVAGMLAIYLVGQLITRVGGPPGYQTAMGLAFAIGILSTLSFRRIREPAMQRSPAPVRAARGSLWREIRSDRNLVLFGITVALWNLSLNVAGPFFGVYLVEELKANAAVVGAIGVVSGLSALPAQRLFGMLSDRWGPRKVQLLTGLIIPLVPIGWALARVPWQVAPVELMAGFVWAGYGLASFNFLLMLVPQERLARYSALVQIIVMAAFAAGAAVGGPIAMRWGYRTVMVISGIGRLVAALLFALLVRQPAHLEEEAEKTP